MHWYCDKVPCMLMGRVLHKHAAVAMTFGSWSRIRDMIGTKGGTISCSSFEPAGASPEEEEDDSEDQLSLRLSEPAIKGHGRWIEKKMDVEKERKSGRIGETKKKSRKKTNLRLNRRWRRGSKESHCGLRRWRRMIGRTLEAFRESREASQRREKLEKIWKHKKEKARNTALFYWCKRTEWSEYQILPSRLIINTWYVSIGQQETIVSVGNSVPKPIVSLLTVVLLLY